MLTAVPALLAEGSEPADTAVVVIGVALGVVQIILWIAAAISILRNDRFTGGGKLLWLVVIIGFPFLGCLGWFFFGRPTCQTRRAVVDPHLTYGGVIGIGPAGAISRRALLAAAPAVTGAVLLGPPTAVAMGERLPVFPQPQVRRSSLGVLATTLRVAFTPQLLPGVGPITTRTYEGGIPGPTLRVRGGDLLVLNQINLLPPNPDQHAHVDHNVPHHFNSFNLHTHGLHVSPTGIADNVFRTFTPFDPANGLRSRVYRSRIRIPRDHEGGTFWYHPHLHGSAAVQLLGGMAGVLIVEGKVDRVPEVAAARDVVMCISELKLSEGRVPDLAREDDLSNLASTFLVNGELNPTIRLRAGEVQRWRLVAACAFTALPIELDGHPLHQIAMDGITFTAPVAKPRVALAMGNRADVLVKAARPGVYRLRAGATTLATLVVEAGAPMRMGLPATLPGPATAIADAEVTGRRTLTFHSDMDAFPGQPFTNAFRITGTGATPATRDAADKTDPTYGRFDPTYVNHRLRLGKAEEWILRNDSTDHPNHPFHLHTNHFLVTAVDGKPLDRPIWQDTIGINQGGSVVIRIRFRDFTGRALVHCHQLQHEDRGMMQLIEYVP